MTKFNTPGFIEPEVKAQQETDTQSEAHKIRLKRLKFRSAHRGIKEADILLGHFAETYLDDLSIQEVDDYERLLREPDSDIIAWITNDREVPEYLQNSVMDKLQKIDYLKVIK